MNINFYLGNISAIIAWSLLLVSFWKNKDDDILYLQVIASFFLIINYIFLKAHIGIIIVILEIIRDCLYIKYENDKKTFILSLPIYIIMGILCFNNLWSIFAIAASLSDGYALIHKGKKVILFGILTYALWLFYDIHYLSYASVLAESILIISNIIIFINHKEEKAPIRRVTRRKK